MTSVQPIDKGSVNFKLVFHNTNKEYWIDPPIGWDKMQIKLIQGEKYARQIIFGEENEIEFSPRQVKLGHQFDRLLSYYNLFGFNSIVTLEIWVDESLLKAASLDFKSAETDKQSYFKAKILVNDLSKIIQDLEDTKIDVFGNESLKGNYNEPAETSNVRLMPKKIKERTRHEIGNVDNEIANTDLISNTREAGNVLLPFGFIQINQSDVGEAYYIDPATGQGLSLIDTPLIYLPSVNGIYSSISNLKFKAGSEIILNFENIHVKVEGATVSNLNTNIKVRIAVIIYSNEDFTDAVDSYYVEVKNVQSKEAIVNETISLTLPKYSRIVYDIRVISDGISNFFPGKITINKDASVTADTVGVYPASNAIMTRLIHVGQKIINNYSENQAIISAPRFFEGGEFWWYFITSGYFIRGFPDSSFDLSFKDWKEFIQNAFNCDVQINGHKIFIGKHEDFYVDKEIARFKFKPGMDSYKVTFNEDLIKNKINIIYNNFEDDKKDTIDAFHTESEWYIPNNIKGTLDVNIPFTADGYSIEYARREGIDAEPTTAKQKDDDVYIIDCMINQIFVPPVPPFIEGGYFDVLQNRQNQGFNIVQNIFSPESAYNLRLSQKRIILDHYATRLSEIGSTLNGGIPTASTIFAKNTFFKSNSELYTEADSTISTYNSGGVKDNSPITGEQLNFPIITPEIFDFTLAIRIKYNELIKLYNDVINERGYITFFKDETVLKIYPKEMNYDWIKEELSIKGERKIEW